MSDLAGLPGAERVERGIRDLNEGRLSTDALLAAVAAGRLRGLGLPVPEDAALPDVPDLALYESLRDHPSGDPYFRYNALRREPERRPLLPIQRASPGARQFHLVPGDETKQIATLRTPESAVSRPGKG